MKIQPRFKGGRKDKNHSDLLPTGIDGLFSHSPKQALPWIVIPCHFLRTFFEIYIPKPTSELKSSRKRVLESLPGDLDAQLTGVRVGAEPQWSQVENGCNFS